MIRYIVIFLMVLGTTSCTTSNKKNGKNLSSKETKERIENFKQKRAQRIREITASRPTISPALAIRFDKKVYSEGLAQSILGQKPAAWSNCSMRFIDGVAQPVTVMPSVQTQTQGQFLSCLYVAKFNSTNKMLQEYYVTDKSCRGSSHKRCIGNYSVLSYMESDLTSVQSMNSINIDTQIQFNVTNKNNRVIPVKMKRSILSATNELGHAVVRVDFKKDSGEIITSVEQPMPLIPMFSGRDVCRAVANGTELTFDVLGEMVRFNGGMLAAISGAIIGGLTGAASGVTAGAPIAPETGGGSSLVLGTLGGFVGGVSGGIGALYFYLPRGQAAEDSISGFGDFIAQQIKDYCNQHNPPGNTPPTPTLPPIQNVIQPNFNRCPMGTIPNICVIGYTSSSGVMTENEDGHATIEVTAGSAITQPCCTTSNAD